jgi:hypothetical protein
MDSLHYVLEIFPEAESSDSFFRIDVAGPIPAPAVDEPIAVNGKHWIVKRRAFLYWEQGCTVQLWCAPSPFNGHHPALQKK